MSLFSFLFSPHTLPNHRPFLGRWMGHQQPGSGGPRAASQTRYPANHPHGSHPHHSHLYPSNLHPFSFQPKTITFILDQETMTPQPNTQFLSVFRHTTYFQPITLARFNHNKSNSEESHGFFCCFIDVSLNERHHCMIKIEAWLTLTKKLTSHGPFLTGIEN